MTPSYGKLPFTCLPATSSLLYNAALTTPRLQKRPLQKLLLQLTSNFQFSNMDAAACLQTRIIIKACVTDIPGEVLKRPITLGKLFCIKILNRELNTHIQRSGFDAVHVLGGYDSQTPLRRWFIYDLNVVEEIGKDELLTVPHSIYQAHLVKDDW
jgi:hypothetical protein